MAPEIKDGTGPDWRICGTGAAQWLQVVRASLEQCERPGAVYRDGVVEVTPPTGPLWLLVLLEAVFDASIQTDPALLREGLVRVEATVADWINAIDRRGEPDGT